MRAWTIVTLLALAACTNGKPSSTDTQVEPDTIDSDTVDDTDDTDFVIDSQGGWEDSFVETGVMQPGDSSSPGPVDSQSPDTGLCPFGEKPDCDGICFPTYFIGDGTCDDGSTFQSNFNCVDYNFDGGDCRSDTGFAVDTDAGCVFEVVLSTRQWPNEIGWEIRDAGGRLLYEVFPGTYANQNRDYVHTVTLEPGSYTFVMIDSFGDGWHGGTFTVRNPVTGEVYATGTIGGGSRGTRNFDVDCEDSVADTDAPAACGDVNVTLETQGWGGEISWDIVDRADTIRAEGDGYLSYQTYNQRVTLGEGYYHFRLYDAFGDGWADGTYSVTDAVTNQVLSSGTLVWGDFSARPFVLSCSDTFDPTVDDTDLPGIPVGPEITCDTVVVAVTTGDDGSEAGWILLDDGGNVVAERAAGGYQSNTTYYIEVPVGSGDYTLQLTDAGGDGWQGGGARVIDVDSGQAFVDESDAFTSGSSYDMAFTADCGGVVTQPDETAIPLDTGLCAPEAEPDCAGICWPSSFIGDGFCDDGTLFAPNFFCPEKGFDGGDCQSGS
jgi:hypothetical protein